MFGLRSFTFNCNVCFNELIFPSQVWKFYVGMNFLLLRPVRNLFLRRFDLPLSDVQRCPTCAFIQSSPRVQSWCLKSEEPTVVCPSDIFCECSELWIIFVALILPGHQVFSVFESFISLCSSRFCNSVTVHRAGRTRTRRTGSFNLSWVIWY